MAAALGADYEAIRREGSVMRMFPFSSERKRMTSIVAQPGSRSALTPASLVELKLLVPKHQLPWHLLRLLTLTMQKRLFPLMAEHGA